MRTADGQAEVLSGVEVGETLVVRGAEALRPGAPVKVVKPGEQAASAPSPAPKKK
jgi:multidrug efflux system membrane fusion protein